MPTEIQITNRNSLTAKRVTATLTNSDTGESVLNFIIGPGEAVILPIPASMTLLVTVEPSPESEGGL